MEESLQHRLNAGGVLQRILNQAQVIGSGK